MSGVCQVTGKKPMTGKNVSHSHIRTNRWFRPNSTKGIKIINKRGIESVLAEMRKRGEKV